MVSERRLRPPFALIALACASQSVAPSSPTVTIHQIAAVAPIRMPAAGAGLPVDYQLEISNPFDGDITLTSVELETVGSSGAYFMKRVRHMFSQKIAPHATEAIAIRAWVQTLQETDAGAVSTPVTLRGVAYFNSASGPKRTAFAARVQ